MILGTLRTRIIEDHTIKEGGFFELEVHCDETMIQQSHSPKEFIFRHIATHLASSVMDTTVPKEYWTFETTERAVRRYGIPAFVNFGATQ